MRRPKSLTVAQAIFTIVVTFFVSGIWSDEAEKWMWVGAIASSTIYLFLLLIPHLPNIRSPGPTTDIYLKLIYNSIRLNDDTETHGENLRCSLFVLKGFGRKNLKRRSCVQAGVLDHDKEIIRPGIGVMGQALTTREEHYLRSLEPWNGDFRRAMADYGFTQKEINGIRSNGKSCFAMPLMKQNGTAFAVIRIDSSQVDLLTTNRKRVIRWFANYIHGTLEGKE